MPRKFQPGSLVTLRNRKWVVMPSAEEDLLMIKPLGGTEDETTGIYLPLQFPEEEPVTAHFPNPDITDIQNFSSAKILYNAARLSFRDVAGPFRSIGKLSFRPKSYQIVPLIMSLRQDIIRLLIADDVGVGKTIEAMMIVRELLDRGEIKRFAVVCLPHLCEQWQQEIKDKFSLDAVIVRSSTAAQLDRKIRSDESIFKAYPFQVISIDFIKTGKHRSIFLSDCPEFVIVDEAHTCTRPSGASIKDQQRYYLVHDIAKKENQHLLLLTATPHSGKQNQFQSLLGLLNPEFATLDIVAADYNKRKEVAKNIIIRRRIDVEQFYENTIFPQRDQGEIAYELSPEYNQVFKDLLSFARGIDISDQKISARKKFKYFAILSLFRGVMSSPLAGIEMLTKKAKKLSDEEIIQEDDLFNNPVADSDETDSDSVPANILDKVELKTSESNLLKGIAERLEKIKDNKAEKALDVLKKWLKDGFNPIVFCRFIPTAKYLGEFLKSNLPATIDLLVITGEMVDEERRQKIDEFSEAKNKKILVATDCLSEGINLQKHFNAVLHYDLVWNPNKLEQREGRVDRFGQTAPEVKTYMLWGKDNPIDSVVLNVLLLKAKEIRKQTGISVPFPEDSQSILDSLINAVILSPNAVKVDNQLSFDLDIEEIVDKSDEVTKAYQNAADRDKLARSVFAQHTIKVDEIEVDLKQTDEAIGNPKAVKDFVFDVVTNLRAQIKQYKAGFVLYTTNLPAVFKPIFNYKDEIFISFDSPTPDGFHYIGRNHPFVEQLCQYVLNNSLNKNGNRTVASRASVIITDKVDVKTTILQMRVRNIISDKQFGNELVAEEVIVWGYEGNAADNVFVKSEDAKNLLEEAYPKADIPKQRQEDVLGREIKLLPGLENSFKLIVAERSNELINAHERFRKLLGGSRYKIVEPVLPPDVLGIYVLLPIVK